MRILLKDESLTDLNAENMAEAFRVYQENIKNTHNTGTIIDPPDALSALSLICTFWMGRNVFH